MKDLIQKIEQWAEERNLIDGSTPQKQMLKLMEEFGELCSGVSKNKPDVVKDSIGDCFVVLVILAKQFKQEWMFDDMEYIDIHPDVSGNGKLEYSLIDTSGAFISFYFESIKKEFEQSEQYFGFAMLGLKEAADYFGFDFKDCVQSAWEEIKDRKGKMIDGIWVKEEDLKNELQQ